MVRRRLLPGWKMTTTTLLLLLLVIVLLFPCQGADAAVDADETADTNKDHPNHPTTDDNKNECTLYIAESTIPNAGLGTFTTRAKTFHDDDDDDNNHQNHNNLHIHIHNIHNHIGPAELCVPFLQWGWHFPQPHRDNSDQDTQFTASPFSNYFWAGHALGMNQDKGEHVGNNATGMDTKISAMCHGIGALVNSHIALVNVRRGIPDYNHDYQQQSQQQEQQEEKHHDQDATTIPRTTNPRLHRQHDAGAGAVTPYDNVQAEVIRDIPAGSELFTFYGENWFAVRTQDLGHVPLIMDYVHAEQMIRKFVNLTAMVDTDTTETTTNPTTTTNPQQQQLQQDLYNLILSIRDTFQTSRTLNAFPDTLREAHVAAQQSISHVHQARHLRSPEWLRRNGRCADHIVPRPSQISGAGRGAFAARPLARGQVVATSPLHHVPQTKAHVMNLYNLTAASVPSGKAGVEDYQYFIRHVDQVVGQQVALNYCYSHPESTLLLCPFGSGVAFINHASEDDQSMRTTTTTTTREEATVNHDGTINTVAGNSDNDHASSYRPNVRIQWARNFSIAHQHEYVDNKPLEALEELEYPVLALEYVALRDIAQGEELLMDYGPEWQEAWTRHVEEWKQSDMPHTPHVYAQDLNERIASSTKVLRTQEEQKDDPYPSNVELRCHYDLIRFPSHPKYTWKSETHGHACRILERYVKEHGIGDDENNNCDKNTSSNPSRDSSCEDDGEPEMLYTVEVDILPLKFDPDKKESRTLTRVVRTLVPRRAIRFFERPGRTDLFLPNAFRHWIGIPDVIFPERWKNRKQ